jgi:predicted DNA-binding transcriptional regulator YafY
MRIDRMLSIIVILLNKNRVSAKELSEKFEVSVRTIYRDIDAINLAGIPVISYSGNNGGFGIMDTFKMDRQLFSVKDMLNVLSALKGMNTALADKELDSAIEKISSLVPREKSEEMKLHLEQIVIDILPWGFTQKQKDYLRLLNQAIGDSKLVNFSYQNTKGEKSSRTVEPMTLMFKGYAWYLFAFCLLKNDYRFFRISRMKNPKILNQDFTRRKNSYQNFIFADPQKNKMVNLVLKYSAEIRQKIEEYFDDDSIIYQEDGDLIVKVTFPEDEWVYSFILSYGEYVEVLEPPHLRKIIQDRLIKTINIYQPDLENIIP